MEKVAKVVRPRFKAPIAMEKIVKADEPTYLHDMMEMGTMMEGDARVVVPVQAPVVPTVTAPAPQPLAVPTTVPVAPKVSLKPLPADKLRKWKVRKNKHTLEVVEARLKYKTYEEAPEEIPTNYKLISELATQVEVPESFKDRVVTAEQGLRDLQPDEVEVLDVSESETKPEPVSEPSAALKALESRLQKVVDVDKTQIHPKQDLFVPSNRRAFKQFIIQTFRAYRLPPLSDIPDPDACQKAAEASKAEVKTFSYQAFVRDYIQRPSPYRGVLVYHGLGSGKTCTSIAAMEALYSATHGEKPVFLFTPASLSKNYRDEITKCGPFIFRTQNHWTFVGATKQASPERNLLLNVLKLPEKWVNEMKGGWVPDPSKPANFDKLSAEDRKDIQKQIYAHIDHRFRFIHYNGLLEKQVREWACNDPTMFDGATIVIDEVHNLIRTINNSNMEYYFRGDEPRTMAQFKPSNCEVGLKYKISYLLYRMLVNSVGSKIIALSGTPIINYPHEIAILANLLAGDTRMAEATVKGLARKDEMMDYLKRHPEVDFAEIVPRPDINASVVRITPVPSGFRKVIDPTTGVLRGFVRDESLTGIEGERGRERNLDAWFQRVGAGIGIKEAKFICVERLPDLEKPFREIFVDTERLQIKKSVEIPLMARLSGLISYYKGGKADLMAKVEFDRVEQVNMSDLQLKEYTAMRKEEIDKEQRAQKKKPAAVQVVKKVSLYDQVTKGQKSTFKIFSRAACNFAFPEDMDRPRPADYRDVMRAISVAKEDLLREKDELESVEGGPEVEAETEVEVNALEAVNEALLNEERNEGALIKPTRAAPKISEYELALESAVQDLKERGAEVFGAENLPRYSPKFQAILNNMDASKGPVLVYSQFKKLEGVGLFSLALEIQKGYAKFDIVKTGGEWTLSDETKAAGPGTPRYIQYTGDIDAEQRNILKAVFNGAWSKMPATLAEEIKTLTGTDHNQKGEIAKVFMITQSGAEGISLSNVRQVHIMEPYWNYVRLEQVKGRAIRICSHMDLPPEERTVQVFTYISQFSAEQVKERKVDETLQNFDDGLTTDQNVLTLSDSKKKLADSLFSVMQQSAVDCELNYTENGTLACYRFSGTPSMDHMFHPIVSVDLAEAEAAVRVRKD